jgi:PAS domain S-box-containing protein
MTSAGLGSEEAWQAQDIRRVFDAIPALAWSARSDGSAEFFNKRWLDYTGFSVEQARDWGWTVALHPDDLEGLVDYWRSVLASREPGEIEARLRRFDGVYRWFLFRATPSFGGDGGVVKWFGTNTDIDDRKRTDEALRSNEQSLRLIFDSIPGFISTHSAAGEVEVINRQSLEYFGKTAEELKKWETSDAVHPDDVPRVIDAWRRAIETGQPVEAEHRSRGADGVYRWFLLRGRPQRDAEGRVVRWYNLVTDIDDRKRAESELERAFNEIAKSEAELRTIIDAIPQLIVALGPDGGFLSANQAFREYTGLTKEDVRSQSFRDVFHPEDTERVRGVREAAISQKVPFEYERRVRHRDGQYRWFLVQYKPLRDERGEIVRFVACRPGFYQRELRRDSSIAHRFRIVWPREGGIHRCPAAATRSF